MRRSLDNRREFPRRLGLYESRRTKRLDALARTMRSEVRLVMERALAKQHTHMITQHLLYTEAMLRISYRVDRRFNGDNVERGKNRGLANLRISPRGSKQAIKSTLLVGIEKLLFGPSAQG